MTASGDAGKGHSEGHSPRPDVEAVPEKASPTPDAAPLPAHGAGLAAAACDETKPEPLDSGRRNGPLEPKIVPAEPRPAIEGAVSDAKPEAGNPPLLPVGAKPQSLEEYFGWARHVLKCDLTEAPTKNRYETNVSAILSAVQETEFFRGIPAFLKACEDEYSARHKVGLLMGEPSFEFVKKSYASVVEKSYRKNVLWNERFPSPPDNDAWVTPLNWYSRLNDLIRGTIVCKFIDGPQFLAEQLAAYANGKNTRFQYYSQERDEGYYAYHFYTKMEMPLMDENWQEQRQLISFEIQITTQLQDVLRQLTHQFYERSRISPTRDDGKWKWDYGTPRFRASYLSHTLHMLEAIIVELRESSGGKTK